MPSRPLVPSSVKPSDLIISIREYIRKFFLCDECSKHFVNMTQNAENEVTSYKESVLYLWRSKPLGRDVWTRSSCSLLAQVTTL